MLTMDRKEEKVARNSMSQLDPPTFALPPDFESNRSRYELWSLRIPVKFDTANLNGVELNINTAGVADGTAAVGGAAAGENMLSSFTVDGTAHSLSMGHPVENENFRLLLRNTTATNRSDEGDEDENAVEEYDGKLRPCPVPFVRHINLVESSSEREMDVAPSAEQAPKPSAGTKLRSAYGPVPQVRGLKRRWVPLGGGVQEKASVSSYVPKTVTTDYNERGHAKKPRLCEDPVVADKGAERVALASPAVVVKQEKDEGVIVKGLSSKKTERSAKKAERKAEKKVKKEKKKEKKTKKHHKHMS